MSNEAVEVVEVVLCFLGVGLLLVLGIWLALKDEYTENKQKPHSPLSDDYKNFNDYYL